MIEVLLILGALALVAACGAFVAAEFSFVTVDRGTVDRAVENGETRRQGRPERAALAVDAALLRAGRHHRHQPADRLHGRAVDRAARRRAARVDRHPRGRRPGHRARDRARPRHRRSRWSSASSCRRTSRSPSRWRRPRPSRASSAASRAPRGLIITVLNNTANAILRRIGIEPQEELASARSPEELASLVRRSAETGTLRARHRGAAAALARVRRAHRARDHDPARTRRDRLPGRLDRGRHRGRARERPLALPGAGRQRGDHAGSCTSSTPSRCRSSAAAT